MSDYFTPISKWSSKQHIWQILKSNGENSLATWQPDYRDFPPMSTNLQSVCDSSSSSFLSVLNMVRPCQCVPTRRREREEWQGVQLACFGLLNEVRSGSLLQSHITNSVPGVIHPVTDAPP